MFVGSINRDVRAMLAEIAPSWKGRPVYVGCSGNFTVERVVHAAGLTEMHGNDVSLYSCALGSTLARCPLAVGVKDDRFAWMSAYLEPGLPTVATLLLSLEYLKFVDRWEPYHTRMRQLYEDRWDVLHAQSVAKVQQVIDGVTLTSFTPGDVGAFVQEAPDDAVVVTFPPTYELGYERLYKKLDAVFAWDAPIYPIFDEDAFATLVETLQTKAAWMTMRDREVPALADFLVGRVQTSNGMKPVFVYAKQDAYARLTTVRQKTDPVPFARADGPVTGDLKLVRLTSGQLNHLRSQYLASTIVPAGAMVNLGVVVGERLVGAMAFSTPLYLGNFCDAYMMCDLAVAPTPHKRLAKLVLAAALSTETKAIVEQSFNTRVRRIGTTAFTKKAASMKYRGLFTVHNKKDDSINYVADAGRWSLAEGMAWWWTKHRSA